MQTLWLCYTILISLIYYNDEYLSVLDEFFKEVMDNGINNVVVDLRNIGGGNSMVGNAFMRSIDVDSYRTWDVDERYGWYLLKQKNIVNQNKKKELVFDGNIYVLTSVHTFSSAMDFAGVDVESVISL